jgi:imidazolonepropionase-like amidohydrolase
MLEGKADAVPAGRTDHWLVRDPAAAEATVDKLVAAGVDCIKMRSYADAPTYRALAAAAAKHHLPFVGHAPWGLDPIVAAEAGQASLEHAFYPWPWDKLSDATRHAIGDAFRTHGTLVTPTLVAWQPFLLPDATVRAVLDDTTGASDPRERTVTPALRHNWRTGVADMAKMRRDTPESRAAWIAALDAAYAELRDLHALGVGLMVGTDTGAPLVFPGAAVHQEMKLFVTKLGLRPLDAILSATIVPAKHLGLERTLGTIERGKLADLVLVSADPLADIATSRRSTP